MREPPILFTGANVRAILEDRKTQTRRVIKPQPAPFFTDGAYLAMDKDGDFVWIRDALPMAVAKNRCGVAGDRLWVKETWRVGKPSDCKRPKDILPPLVARGKGITVLYEAGGWKSVGPVGRKEPDYPDNEPMPRWAGKRRPSIFMPREFSRILLEIESVRVERLQDITEEDAKAEGVSEAMACGFLDTGNSECSMRCKFKALWNSINAKSGFGWDVNPWVLAVTFRRVQ